MLDGNGLALIGAAIAACAGCGSGMGVGIAGQAAAGVVASDVKTGFLSGAAIDLTVTQGLYFLAAGIPIGVVGFASGIGQGRAAASALQLMAKRSDQMGKGIVYTVMVETYAIFAFVVSILIWSNIAI